MMTQNKDQVSGGDDVHAAACFSDEADHARRSEHTGKDRSGRAKLSPARHAAATPDEDRGSHHDTEAIEKDELDRQHHMTLRYEDRRRSDDQHDHGDRIVAREGAQKRNLEDIVQMDGHRDEKESR